MYRLGIDYEGKQPVGKNWYGNFDGFKFPSLPKYPNFFFYNVISLDISTLPQEIAFSVPITRIYLPNYFFSDLVLEDLFFRVTDGYSLLDADLFSSYDAYEDELDHSPKRVEIFKLDPVENPSSSQFDLHSIRSPHHQLAGNPFYKNQEPFVLICPKCHKNMDFFVQFDSDENLFEFEDDGMAYYWLCKACLILGCRVESG